MYFWKRYQLTKLALKELRRAGLNEAVLETLRTRSRGRPLKRDELLDLLETDNPHRVSAEESELVLRHTQLSLLRLEKLIPHRGVREWVDALVFAVVIASIVRTFIVAPFKIPSGSMIPTIHVGDHIFATMYSYGLHVPFTDLRLFPQEVERGDIVIFPFPGDPSVDYIKRVVGVGGDRLEVRDTRVYIDGEPLEEPYAYHDPDVLRAYRRTGQSPPDFGPVRVPEGSVFLMGDNRLNSSDSRVWGFLKASEVKGEALIIYWSHDPRAGLLSGYNLARIGTVLR